MALTKVTGHVVLPTTNIEFHNTKSTGIVTFTHTSNATSSTTGALQITGGVGIVKDLFVGGNITVGGTITYDDVTNIDSLGIITARAGINVSGGNVTIANNLDVDGHTELDNLNVSGVSTFSSVINANNGINLTDADNKSILLGEHEDLRIRHTGSHSEITDEGTGSLRFGGDQIVIGNSDFTETNAIIKQGAAGYVTLKQNGTTRLQTTSSGVVVTGIITASQFSSVNGSNSGFFKDNQLSFSSSGDGHIDHTTNEKDILFRLSKSSALDTTMMRIDSSAEQTKFHKYVTVGLQGGNDTAVLGGGSGIGAMLILNHASTGRNTFLTGNSDSYLCVNHGNLGIGTANPSGKVDISANASQSMLMFNTRDASSASNFARMGYNSAAGVSILDIRSEGHTRLLTGGNNERIRFSSNGGVGINTDKIRNTKNLSIAGVTRDYTNSGTDLVDAGGIILQPTISLPSTGQSYPGIFWSGNTAALGRARAGILGVAASNHDATDLVFLTKNSGSGHGLYPSDERMRLTNSGKLIIGHTSSPDSDSDRLQVISTSSGTGINLFNYSASAYGNQIGFMKSRSNTIGNNTILQNGDRIGELNFYGNDGSGRSLGAQISVRLYATPSNDNTPAAIYFKTGTNQSMDTRLSILPAGNVGISKNGWASSDNTFGLTVHTGSTSETGPVHDGIMIVSQQNNGNQNSSTGKLMFCGHAQTNGPFLYGDGETAYGKKGLVFHTLSTANDYTTQLEETARFTHSGRFGLGTGTAVDSLMHIQGNSDSGDEACQLIIEDEDDTAGSKIPSIQFKGNGSNTCRIRGTDTSGITFATWNGSSQILRSIIGNMQEGGAFLLNADDRGWATFRHNNNQGLRTHIRRHYSPGAYVQTQDIMRIRRYWWGWGTYKITCRALYYNSSLESVYYVNGHLSGGNHISIAKQTFGGDASNQDWNCTVTHTASNNAPGGGSPNVWYADIKVNIPNYYYVVIIVEAYSSGYSTNPNVMGIDSYCML